MVQTHTQYIGILSDEFNNSENVYINKFGLVQFKITLLNEPDNPCEITSFLDKLSGELPIDNPNLPDEDRINTAREWLKNRIFIFFVNENSRYYSVVTDITSIEKNDNFREDISIKMEATLPRTEVPAETTVEKRIIDAMHWQCVQQKLNFPQKDLINFHLSVKCNPLVVLTEQTECEENSLLNIYLHALDILPKQTNDFPQYYKIAVQPTWTDDVSFFGIPDYENGIYRSSESGFIEALICAQQHPNQLFFICLDGINISQPQLYLSPFLAVLHKNKPQRYIQLYQCGIKKYLKNSASYPERVFVGDNVRIIGTLHKTPDAAGLSLDMLRRINIIHINKYESNTSLPETNYQNQYLESMEWTSTAYNQFTDHSKTDSTSLQNIITEISEKIAAVNPNLAITRNEKNEILTYYRNALNLSDSQFSLNLAADYQITQRILTKIYGTEKEWEEVLGDDENSLLYLLNKYEQISTFEECRKAIFRKREELRQTGTLDYESE